MTTWLPAEQAVRADGDVTTIHAAGVVCWRPGPDGVEVLLVHRPRYDDWSFPKGKQHEGELLAQTAVRELFEETGVSAVLGRPLPGTAYTVATGEPKQVTYWSGRAVRFAVRTASPQEVDDVRWLPAGQARETLTAPGDRAVLDALLVLHSGGGLATTPLLVLRHAVTRPRDSWPRADAERPLVAAGKRQAAALAGLLACWQPEQVLSSPWRRCTDTLEPWAAASGVRVRTKGGLSESGFRRDPGKARRHTTRLIGRARPALVCTHRPVLAGVLDALSEAAGKDGNAVLAVRALIPDADPYLAAGEVLVAHVAHSPGSPARVVAVERHVAPR